MYCVWYTVRQFTHLFGLIFFPVKIHYLMSCSIWLCSKWIIFFSTSQILHFWNKVCEKGELFFCSINLLDGIHCRKCFFTQRFGSWIYSRLQVRVLSLERQFLFYYYSSLAVTRIRTRELFRSSVLWITSPER